MQNNNIHQGSWVKYGDQDHVTLQYGYQKPGLDSGVESNPLQSRRLSYRVENTSLSTKEYSFESLDPESALKSRRTR